MDFTTIFYRQSTRTMAVILLAAWHHTVLTAEDTTPRKKFIELGWDIPSTSELRESWREMEAATPFDGVMFKLEGKDGEGHQFTSEAIWDGRPWQRAWLEPALADLQSCRFSRFTDNFLRFNATPGNLEWPDEAGWAAMAGKAGHVAWLMKQAGGKGLAIDFESYGAQQFKFDASKGRSFAEISALARQRGALFTRAIAREFPEAVLLTLWMNSINLQAGTSDEPAAILANAGYGLLPAFIDGMLDAAPPAMRLVDGCENGYYLDSAEEYLRTAHAMRSWQGGAIRLVSPENRPKYRRQVQGGFGFYLDMFLNEATNRYYRGPLNGSRLARLERNLGYAHEAADEYVWIYGEQCRWWGKPLPLPATRGRGRLWEEAMPGITRAIAYVRNPAGAARDEIAKLRTEGKLTNLAFNGDFSQPASPESGAPPARFETWQDGKTSAGKFGWEAKVGGGSAHAVRVKWGCFLQAHPVQPGEKYAVQAACLPRGKSNPTLIVRWQTTEGRWTHESDDRTFVFSPDEPAVAAMEKPRLEPSANWRKAFAMVTVPPDTGKMVILLNVTGQTSDQDECWFDDLGLYALGR